MIGPERQLCATTMAVLLPPKEEEECKCAECHSLSSRPPRWVLKEAQAIRARRPLLLSSAEWRMLPSVEYVNTTLLQHHTHVAFQSLRIAQMDKETNELNEALIHIRELQRRGMKVTIAQRWSWITVTNPKFEGVPLQPPPENITNPSFVEFDTYLRLRKTVKQLPFDIREKFLRQLRKESYDS